MGVKEYHIVVLIFIFLITNEVEQVLSKQTLDKFVDHFDFLLQKLLKHYIWPIFINSGQPFP